jgi:two-component sensor histidine kinase
MFIRVVDDSPVWAQSLAGLLSKTGEHVARATGSVTSGNSGYDLSIFDAGTLLALPHDQVREVLSAGPFMVLSADFSGTGVGKWWDLGARDVVCKCEYPAALLARVANASRVSGVPAWVRQLHDEGLQSVAAARILLSAERSEDAADALTRAQEQLRALIATSLKGQHAVSGSLVSVQETVSGVITSLGFEGEVTVKGSGQVHDFVDSNWSAFISEALSNAVRHADAGSLSVDLNSSGGSGTSVRVTDNGRGMPAVLSQEGHAGFALQCARAQSVRGLLSWCSTREGTVVELDARTGRPQDYLV